MCPVPEADRVKACPSGLGPSADGLIDDFEDGDNQLSKTADRGGYWYTSRDPAGSTIDPTPFKVSDGGSGGSRKSLHVYGQTASDPAAWGVQWGASFVQDGVYDGAKYGGFSFKAKVGSNSTKRVRFKVADINTHPDGGICKSCWNSFGKDLDLTTEWKEYRIAYSEMTQEPGWGDPFPAIVPSKLFQINWSIKGGQQFDVWLDDVQFLDCK